MTLNFSADVLTTPKAAMALGISVTTLNRYASETTGIFQEGDHWRRRSPGAKGTKIFNLPKCVERLQSLGYAIPHETLEALTHGN